MVRNRPQQVATGLILEHKLKKDSHHNSHNAHCDNKCNTCNGDHIHGLNHNLKHWSNSSTLDQRTSTDGS